MTFWASNDLETDGSFSIITGADGASYGKLDFSQYMVQFISDRYVNFEVSVDSTEGLKIPVTAVTTKNFYLVPLEYMVQGGDISVRAFLRKFIQKTDSETEFTPATIYYSTEDYYYIDMGENAPLKAGDYMVKPDSQDRYQIGSSASLQGVYNINKGYAVFKQIEILNSNDEYYTIKKGTSYGLSVYDHIVLNADTVDEGRCDLSIGEADEEGRINSSIQEHIKEVEGKLRRACLRQRQSKREDITLIAVSKTKPLEDLIEAYEAGCRDFGENKVQEILEKDPKMPPDARFHMIGHLQRNKVKQVLAKVVMIHSVDSVRLGRADSAESAKAGRKTPILLEVNVAKEESKFGFLSGAGNGCCRDHQ